jgi:hypothetical protein
MTRRISLGAGSALLLLTLCGCPQGAVNQSSSYPKPEGVGRKTPDESASSVAETLSGGSGGGGGGGGAHGYAMPSVTPTPEDETGAETDVIGTATNAEFARETTMKVQPGKARQWQNGPSPEEMAAYQASRQKKAAPAAPAAAQEGNAGMPVFDNTGITEVQSR